MEQTTARLKLNFSIRFAVLLGLTIAVYFFIFSMSAQDGSTSGGLSEKLTALIVPRDAESFSLWHHLVRKGAHVTEFALLFIMWFGCVDEGFPMISNRARVFSPYLLVLASAAADEIHQIAVPGRSGQVTDVLIDMIGVTLIALALLAYYKRRAEAA